MDKYELYHHGIKGMKWGVRRYQNKDGSLTAAGKKRAKTIDSDIERYSSRGTKAEGKFLKLYEKGDMESNANKRDRLYSKAFKYEAKSKKMFDKANQLRDEKETLKQPEKPKPKSVKEMSEQELTTAIRRLELEKRYKDLNPERIDKGKTFVSKVLERAGENVTTQLATYVMGDAVNRIFKDVYKDAAIINPKKGQKDK